MRRLAWRLCSKEVSVWLAREVASIQNTHSTHLQKKKLDEHGNDFVFYSAVEKDSLIACFRPFFALPIYFVLAE